MKEYPFVTIDIRLWDENMDSDHKVYEQTIPMSLLTPDALQKIIAIVNKLEVPNV